MVEHRVDIAITEVRFLYDLPNITPAYGLGGESSKLASRGFESFRGYQITSKETMTDEDRTAAKLKGFNCFIKFKDGEELLLNVADLAGPDEDDISNWFCDVEKFIRGSDDVEYFPAYGIAVDRTSIKYVKLI